MTRQQVDRYKALMKRGVPSGEAYCIATGHKTRKQEKRAEAPFRYYWLNS